MCQTLTKMWKFEVFICLGPFAVLILRPVLIPPRSSLVTDPKSSLVAQGTFCRIDLQMSGKADFGEPILVLSIGQWLLNS